MSDGFGLNGSSPRERLVHHVQELERLVEAKQAAADLLKEAFTRARDGGFDPATLRVVLKLRKMSPHQRRERRALESIYMAALGMLDGDALPDEARRRLDGQRDEPSPAARTPEQPTQPRPAAPQPPQPALELKDPEDARREGGAAAAAGKRIYDNPYPAGDPCRAAWDEGWCAHRKSDGMETPAAYQRRTPDKDGRGDDKDAKGAAA